MNSESSARHVACRRRTGPRLVGAGSPGLSGRDPKSLAVRLGGLFAVLRAGKCLSVTRRPRNCRRVRRALPIGRQKARDRAALPVNYIAGSSRRQARESLYRGGRAARGQMPLQRDVRTPAPSKGVGMRPGRLSRCRHRHVRLLYVFGDRAPQSGVVSTCAGATLGCLGSPSGIFEQYGTSSSSDPRSPA